jgi:heme oxygenase
MASSVAPLARAAALPTARVPASARPRAVAPARARRACSRDTIRALAHGDAAPSSGGGGAAAAPAHGHGHGHGGSPRRPGEKKGFVEEMRFVAMKLHTREQAPKEGERKPEPESRPMAQWAPTKEGYLKYLVESRAVYEAMEAIVASGASPIYAAFVDTGLERTEALSADIAWFERAHGMPAPPADGPGAEYAAFLRDLAESSPPEFICHFYNVYFAHSAGGRMIGRKVSEMILDGKELAFYKWGGRGLETSLADVKEKLNQAAEGWSREEKDACLEETSKSFQLSGKLLRLIA